MSDEACSSSVPAVLVKPASSEGVGVAAALRLSEAPLVPWMLTAAENFIANIITHS